jgi:hypothetical protein
MDELKIHFVDFWPNFKNNDNYFYHLLSTEYKIILDEHDPDILFYSFDYTGNPQHYKYNNKRCIKVYYTGECSVPDYNQCHFSFTFEHDHDERNYRLPLWGLHINWFNVPDDLNRDQSYLHPINMLLEKEKIFNKINKEKFCSFISSNPKGNRMSFVPKLNAVKQVDCIGRLFNNVTQNIKGRGDQIWKILELKPYKFNISFENTSHNGYVTEKIIHPMFVNTIPIYWGSKRVGEDFNSKSFISQHNFSSEEEMIDYIIEIDNNKNKYEEILNQPWFNNNKYPEFILPQNVINFFKLKILPKIR